MLLVPSYLSPNGMQSEELRDSQIPEIAFVSAEQVGRCY